MEKKRTPLRRRVKRIRTLLASGERSRKDRFRRLRVEQFEDRRLLAGVTKSLVGNVLTVNVTDSAFHTIDLQVSNNGNGTDGQIRIRIDGGSFTSDLDDTAGGSQTQTISSIAEINVSGGAGAAKLDINHGGSGGASSNKFFGKTNGGVVVRFDGGTGAGVGGLSFGGTPANPIEIDRIVVGPTPGSGSAFMSESVSLKNLTVIYKDVLSGIVDSVPGPLVIEATDGDNAISYREVTANGVGQILIDNLLPAANGLQFTNKSTLTINALGGSDTINLNNPSTPAGLTSITVNGGDPTAGSDELIVNGIAGSFDDFLYSATAAGAGVITKSAAAQPPVTFSGTEHLTIVGQNADSDALRQYGLAGPNT